ncbi:MAG: lysylphosphatidylglycerol synthase transmembrane domain-containing protein [Nitrospirota bacterium]
MAPKANKIAFLVLKVCVSLGLLYLVLSKTGLDRVVSIVGNISLPAFLAAIALYLFAQFLSTLRWKLFLPGELSVGKLFSLYMIGSFFNTLLPGLIGGDAVKGYYLYRTTGEGGRAFASVFMDRYIGFVVLIAICAAAFPFGYSYFRGSGIVWILPATVLSFVASSLLIFGLRLGNRFTMIASFYSYFHSYWKQKGIMGKTMLLSVIVQLSGFLAVYVIALGIGQHIPFLALLVFLPLIVLFTMLPISISGIGVREGAFVLFFGLIGVKPEVATAISFSWFITISAAGLLGLVEYIRFKKEGVNLH